MAAYPLFRRKRVTVVGLGIEGVDLLRYLAKEGACLTATDVKTAEQLAPRLKDLEGLPVRLVLGSNPSPEDVDADAVFVSQGVPLDLPALALARRQGVPLSSMTRLFLERCPGPVVGISGSNGKTTTTALVGAMFAASGRDHVVGGNIGVGILALLDRISAETWSVLEISHTQLELTGQSPHVACLLNVTPNHLDRYSWDSYVSLKENLLRHQTAGDVAVLNYSDQVTREIASRSAARVLFFSTREEPPGDGAFVRDSTVVWRRNGVEVPVVATSEVPLRGDHNLENALAAVATSGACGLAPDAMAKGIRGFRPVPHRLEFVARTHGVDYYNDSIATTPERALAGLRAFQEPVVLLLGGREKRLPLEEMAREACRRCWAVVTFGEAAPSLDSAMRSALIEVAGTLALKSVSTLAEAVEAAHEIARPGHVVLLSPACTSFDAYDNFEQRGEEFRRLVRAIGGER